MKKYINYIVVLLLLGIVCPSFIVEASGQKGSWQEISCDSNVENRENKKVGSCEKVSSSYTVPYCLSLKDPVVDYALDCIWPSITNTLSSVQEPDKEGSMITKRLNSFDTKNVVEQYCKALLGNGNMGRIYYAVPSSNNDSWDWQQTFDSHQSIFVNALCSSFKDKDGEMPFVEEFYLEDIFKDEDLAKILKLRQRSGGDDLCSLVDSQTLEDCDLSVYATDIFSAIMSDIFKIKYAQVLHVDTAENFESRYREKVQAFMSGYYNITEVDWGDYNRLKATFPQTISILESNQKYYKNVLNTLKILDNSWLAKKVDESQCPVEGNMALVDFIACALHSSEWKGFSLTPSFVTLFYNEVMNYRIFELYVNSWIDEKAGEMRNIRKEDKEIRKTLAKSLDFQGYVDIQIEASKQALLRFEDFNMSYPLHIGLLLYQESMKNFRDNRLSPIVTLFYSLSEKLQNVQLPN